MDIRVAAYGTNTVSTFTNGPKATTYVQSAANSAPVGAVAPVQAQRPSEIAEGGNGGGYTDSVRGSIINILA